MKCFDVGLFEFFILILPWEAQGLWRDPSMIFWPLYPFRIYIVLLKWAS